MDHALWEHSHDNDRMLRTRQTTGRHRPAALHRRRVRAAVARVLAPVMVLGVAAALPATGAAAAAGEARAETSAAYLDLGTQPSGFVERPSLSLVDTPGWHSPEAHFGEILGLLYGAAGTQVVGIPMSVSGECGVPSYHGIWAPVVNAYVYFTDGTFQRIHRGVNGPGWEPGWWANYGDSCANTGGTAWGTVTFPTGKRFSHLLLLNANFTDRTTWYPLYHPDRPVDDPIDEALPLLGAHGITASPGFMLGPLAKAEELVPTLVHTASAQTAEIGGVWQNAAVLSAEAIYLASQSEHSQVNVLAHSKGGLEARAAMFEDPTLFRALGMMATPNLGSVMADIMCGLQRRPTGDAFLLTLFPTGPCVDEDDALYSLQTGWMKEFNNQVRDLPQHTFFVVAGECTGEVCAAGNLVNVCPPIPGSPFGGPFGVPPGGDGVVCVASAFGLSSTSGNGRHFDLRPTHGEWHNAMTADGPLSHIVALLYGSRNQNNPYHGESAGQEVSLEAALVSATEADAPRLGTGGFVAASDTGDAQVYPVQVEQRRDVVMLAAGVAYDVVVDPEGGDSAIVEIFSTGPLEVEAVVAEEPDDVAPVLTQGDVLGVGVHVVRFSDLGGAAQRLRLTSAAGGGVGVVTRVEPGGVTVAGDVLADVDGRGAVTLAVTGLSPSEVNRTSAAVSVNTPSGALEVPMTLERRGGGAGDVRTYTAEVPLTPGTWNPVDISLAGPVSRILTVSTVAEDGTGSIGRVVAEALQDTDGDSAVDSLVVEVEVEVGLEDTYRLAADFVDASGQVAFSASAAGSMAPGTGILQLVAPTESLLAGGSDGPYTIANVIMTRGTDVRYRVAHADEIGRVGAYPRADLPAARLDLLGTELGPVTPDSSPPTLAVTAMASVAEPGRYRLEASLEGPDGTTRATSSVEDTLPIGNHSVTLMFDAQAVAPDGFGTYTVRDLTISPADSPGESVLARPAAFTFRDPTVVDPADTTITGLRLLWEEARRSGELPQTGFYISEHLRLLRAETAASEQRNWFAVAELERFIEHLESRGNRLIPRQTVERLLIAAHEALAGLSPHVAPGSGG